MLKPWRFKTTQEQDVHVVSDTHFHHEQDFIYKPRGYTSSPEHDAGVIKIWNERVKPNDIVLHNGDFIFNADLDLTIQYVNQLNGHIHMTWGNHNSGVKQLFRLAWWNHINKMFLTGSKFVNTTDEVPFEIYPLTWYNAEGKPKFTFVGHYMYGKVNHTEFVMCHFAFRTWDKMGKGAINISGHSHGNDKESNPDFLDVKRCDFGIENFSGPVSWKDVEEIYREKKTFKTDHHGEHTSSSSF